MHKGTKRLKDRTFFMRILCIIYRIVWFIGPIEGTYNLRKIASISYLNYDRCKQCPLSKLFKYSYRR